MVRSLSFTLALALVAAVAGSSACGTDRVTPPPTPTVNACGNGRVDQGETCDKAIATSSVGACPSKCFDGIACTTDTLIGSANACNAACSFQPISACTPGDGCCPQGCTGATDSDCSTTCGNSTVDQGETCDGDCPSGCSDNVACTTDTAYGEVSTCSLSCGYRVVSNCQNGDGCCPAGCNADTDPDCSRTCGNGMVEAGEVCDGNCPGSCEDGDACTIGVLSGSAANCNVQCTQQQVRACAGGDGCCPAGCSHAADSDCPAVSCSGVSQCTGGDGCCPSGCTNASDRDCPAPPSCANVTQCIGGDTCCPSACTSANDSDCTPVVTGGVGSPCTGPADCAALGSGATCFQDGYPGGYCTKFCTSDPCPSGSMCHSNQFLCIDVCQNGVPNDCRSGYVCDTVLDFNTERPFFGCVPGAP